MWLSITTWNGTNINDGSPYYATIPQGQLSNLSRSTVLVNRANDYPFLSTAVENGSTLAIQVRIAPGQNINTYRETLKRYFFGDTQKHNLVAVDLNDSSRQYYRSGFPIRLNEETGKPNSFIIIIQTDVPYWTTVSAVTDPWSITATGQTHVVSNIGGRKAKPVFTFTATTTKAGGLLYRRYLPIENSLDVSYADSIDITDGGLDTAALTTTKMQADGDDFRVWEDGAFTDRWLQDMDDTDTKCWKNHAMLPKHTGTLLTTISNTGSTKTIAFTQTRESLELLQFLAGASNKVLMIEDEAFTYSASNIDFANYQITSCPRAQKDTTAATHTAPLTVRHIEKDNWILYGDSTLTAPDVNDDNKPMFDLTSTNEARSFTNFFDTTAPNRPFSWKAEVNRTRTGLSYTFTSDENTFTDPSDELGLALIGSEGSFNPVQEAGQLDWIWQHPAGVTDVDYSLKKYMTGSWPAIVGLQYFEPGSVWFTAQNEAEPSAPLAWESAGPYSVTLPGSYQAIRFAIDGSIENLTNEKAMAQFDGVTATVDSGNLPTIGLGAETAMNFFDVKLTNNTTGEWLKFKCPCLINQTVTIDCENKLAYLSDGSKIIVTFSSEREAWLDLDPGNNTLQYDDTGTVAVTQGTSYYAKVL